MLYYFTMINANDLRRKFADYWSSKKLGHREIPPAPLVLKEDPTTLFTSSGMQQLVPNLTGSPHPLGKRLYNIQPCFRATDIDEVGDNRHTCFFEMMGNWSLGDYFKEEQIPWMWDFFVKELELSKSKLYISVFSGTKEVPKDLESELIWKKLGISDDHIFFYDATKNWWSRSGPPEKMPDGEIGGPDAEVFYEFTDVPHDKKFGENCHPNCDCGRFLEIGNSVFIQYQKNNGKIIEMEQKNVDYGGGFERILSAINDQPDMFKTELFIDIVKEIEENTSKKYTDPLSIQAIRIIADHLKVAVFLIIEGIVPSNKEHGYILRRYLRRAAVKMHQLTGGLTPSFDQILDRGVLRVYDGIQGIDRHKQRSLIFQVVNREMERFSESLDRGLKHFTKLSDNQMEAEAFNLFASYGFPFEITAELAKQRGVMINKITFDEMYKTHQKLSRKVSSGMFKGGLADHSEQVIRYHTATHLLHQSLRDVLGDEVRQEGSNITGERLRFDFSLSRKPSDEEIKKVEEIINQKIKEALPARFEIMPKEKADQIGALSFFKEKYGDKVKVYFIGGSSDNPGLSYSKEFCGGPHIANTSEIGPIKITKIKKIGANLIRIYLIQHPTSTPDVEF